MISYSSFELDSFARSPFVHDCTLSSLSRQLHVKALLNIDAIDYSFIDEDIARIVCDKFDIEPVALQKPKPLKDFNGRMAEPVTHAIYPNLTLQNHTESLAPMLITKLGNHQLILGKPWMNARDVLLDMQSDSLIFVPGRCSHPGAPNQYFASTHPLSNLRITPAPKTPPKLQGISPK